MYRSKDINTSNVYPFPLAPVVQWIELLRPKEEIGVRFFSGAQEFVPIVQRIEQLPSKERIEVRFLVGAQVVEKLTVLASGA